MLRPLTFADVSIAEGSALAESNRDCRAGLLGGKSNWRVLFDKVFDLIEYFCHN
jgi:hypothetical protein